MTEQASDQSAEQIARGHEAEQLLAHPMIASAFAEIRAGLLDQLAEVNMHDEATKNELLRSVKNLRRVREIFEHHVMTGTYATAWLKKSKSREMMDRARHSVDRLISGTDV